MSNNKHIYNIFVKFLFKISRNVPRHVNKENTATVELDSQNHILNPRCHMMKLRTTLINKLATIFTIAKNYSQICLHLIILNHRLSYFFHCAFNKIVNSSI